MKLDISKKIINEEDQFFITIDGIILDKGIESDVKIIKQYNKMVNYNDYRLCLIKNNSFFTFNEHGIYFYFKNKEDAKNAINGIEVLISIEVMRKLTE